MNIDIPAQAAARDVVIKIQPAESLFDMINVARSSYVEAMATAIITWLESGDDIPGDSAALDAISTWLSLSTDNVTFYDVLGLVDEHFA